MTATHFVTSKDNAPINGHPLAGVALWADGVPGIARRQFDAREVDTTALPYSVRSHLHV